MTDAQTTTVPITSWLPALVAAWIIPGAGHFILRRPGTRNTHLHLGDSNVLDRADDARPMFQPQGGDLLTTLIYYGGFLSHIATGAMYFITIALGYHQPDVAGHVYDYGSKFLVGAGLLNILAMVDVHEIGTGRKS